MCDDYMVYIHNVDLVLRDIQEEVNENKHNLREYKDEFEMSLRHNESEIKSLLEAIAKIYEERMTKMELVQKMCQRNVEYISKIYKHIGEFENRNKEICNDLNKTII